MKIVMKIVNMKRILFFKDYNEIVDMKCLLNILDNSSFIGGENQIVIR
jgi:hypothetical protein